MSNEFVDDMYNGAFTYYHLNDSITDPDCYEGLHRTDEIPNDFDQLQFLFSTYCQDSILNGPPGTLPVLKPILGGLLVLQQDAENLYQITVDGGDVWHVYNGSLPHVGPHRLEPNYKSGRIRVGTTGRGVWENDLPCWQDPDLVLTEDLTIDNFARYHQNIIVPNGLVLKVTGEMQMSTNTKIEVQIGGRLIVDGGKITNACADELWRGIIILGNANEHQWIADQGRVNLKNGAIIENARIGIETGIENDFSDAGGYVMASNSTFKNCPVAVRIHPYISPLYPSNNRNDFYKCDFLIEAPFPTPLFGHHTALEMKGVKGVDIDKCSFLNLADCFELGDLERGKAIVAINSDFDVFGTNETYDGPGDVDHSTIYGFFRGMEVNSGASNSFNLEKMEFQENRVGLVVIGTHNERIVDNNFHVPATSCTVGTNTYGAYLYNSSGYILQENSFTASNAPAESWAGLVLNNSGNAMNLSYRNTFNNFFVGSGVLNDNREPIGNKGLEIRCNLFDNNSVDIYLANDVEWRDFQGLGNEATLLTNNKFSFALPNCVNDEDVHIDIDESQGEEFYGMLSDPDLFFDYHCIGDEFSKLSCEADPNSYFDHVQVFVLSGEENTSYNYSALCPVLLDGGGNPNPIPNLLTKRFEHDTSFLALQTALDIYDATINQGETEDLMAVLANAYQESSEDLRDLLLSRYPLSDSILMAVVDIGNLMDPWHVTLVFVSNARINPDVMTYLEHAELLSPYFMSYIYDANNSGNNSLKTILEAEISVRNTEELNKRLAVSEAFHFVPDSLKDIPLYDFNIEYSEDWALLWRSDYFKQMGDTASAIAWIDSLAQNWYPVKAFQSAVMDITLGDSLNASQENYMWNRFYADELDQGLALAYLHAANLTDTLPELPYPNMNKNNVPRIKPNQSKFEKPELDAVPNPADHTVRISYPFEFKERGQIQIYNLTGSLVTQLKTGTYGFIELDVKKWPSGIYLAQLIDDLGKKVNTVKFEILH